MRLPCSPDLIAFISANVSHNEVLSTLGWGRYVEGTLDFLADAIGFRCRSIGVANIHLGLRLDAVVAGLSIDLGIPARRLWAKPYTGAMATALLCPGIIDPRSPDPPIVLGVGI